MRTDREQTNRQTENSKPEATLIPVDSRGERANIDSPQNNAKQRKIQILLFIGREQRNSGIFSLIHFKTQRNKS